MSSNDNVRQRKATIDAPADDEEKPMSFAEEIRQRRASQRLAAGGDGGGLGGGSPFLLFNKLDMILLAIMCVVIWFVVKMNYKIDLWEHLWEQIRPNYDPGHWDYYDEN